MKKTGTTVFRSEMRSHQREYFDAIVRSLDLSFRHPSVEALCEDVNDQLVRKCQGQNVQIYAYVHEGRLVLDALHVGTTSGVRQCPPPLPSFP